MVKIPARIKLITVVAAVILFSFWAYRSKAEIYTLMYDYKLIPIKEKLTELYFENHLNLPTKVVAGKKVDFSFAIHNLEGGDREYPYTVFLKTLDGRLILIDQNTAFLKNNETKIIDESYDPTESIPNGTIIVDLNQLNQQIHFIISDK